MSLQYLIKTLLAVLMIFIVIGILKANFVSSVEKTVGMMRSAQSVARE